MIQIIGGNSSRLALDTAQANSLDNEQIFEVSAFEVAQFKELDTNYGTNVIRRSEPTPIYNCHGMTFASRRTGLFETEVLQQILLEDSYVEISKESVIAGDVILYYSPDGDIEHSGIVIEPPNRDKNLNVPTVCSKWGKYAELLHPANRCPYDFSNVKYYRVKYD